MILVTHHAGQLDLSLSPSLNLQSSQSLLHQPAKYALHNCPAELLISPRLHATGSDTRLSLPPSLPYRRHHPPKPRSRRPRFARNTSDTPKSCPFDVNFFSVNESIRYYAVSTIALLITVLP